ncbi:McrC family protein [Robertkochia solimangrovi]|uniref:McrC family protein n=1 Tax=Robertkochia solimangrovi TaxID=2213046 RepID=UPI00117EB5A4|nr:restriction endonuclease [Robertkochia solimangrovi]TRZ46148.1 restriction endonuclease [Robertkochia solimangrovi]
MKQNPEHITVFEHETLRIDRGDQRLTKVQLEALQLFYGENGVPYYSLIHHGVRFNEYVGVIQLGNLVIEVLPKADKSNPNDERVKFSWRNVLISMLHAVGILDIHAPSNSNLNLRQNSILDLYFELYIREVEYLQHRGLIKKYRKTEGNRNALKGSIQFAKHLNQNLVRQERFYVKHSTYDKEHVIHAILFKALKLLSYINTNIHLKSRLGASLLNFPEQNDIKITESVFDRIAFDRKAEPYRNALEIAKLLLLNYHPDVNRGTNNVLALMFDMNMLWEQFVFISLRKHKASTTSIAAQNTRNFWKPLLGYHSKMKPDIVINKDSDNCIVLDTKWKNLSGYNPSPEDLRQMFVYLKYYKAKRVALLYPGTENTSNSGFYYDHNRIKSNELGEEECAVISIGVDVCIKKWQLRIFESIENWCQIL